MTLLSLEPRWLWAAAQFAATPGTNHPKVIDTVHIQHMAVSHHIRLTATDGHRAIRIWIPTTNAHLDERYHGDAGLVLNTQHLHPKGKMLRGTLATISTPAESTQVVVSRDMDILEIRSVAVKDSDFPSLDPLWPDTWPCDTAAPLHLKPRYVAEFCKLLDALDCGVVKFRWGSSTTTPVLFSAELKDDVLVEYLLMPVQTAAL